VFLSITSVSCANQNVDRITGFLVEALLLTSGVMAFQNLVHVPESVRERDSDYIYKGYY
jgi:hypothetical protein